MRLKPAFETLYARPVAPFQSPVTSFSVSRMPESELMWITKMPEDKVGKVTAVQLEKVC